jgi:hypothetical protein
MCRPHGIGPTKAISLMIPIKKQISSTQNCIDGLWYNG